MIASTLGLIILIGALTFVGMAALGFWIVFFILAFGIPAVIVTVAVLVTYARGIFYDRRRSEANI